ncbi:MAG: hypothetical protein DWQ31_15785 [Planctomycetota bacterium]|nr:MAG: hypothetical protein DWQ31_15785 [Planctomycetota bacterium]
MAAPERKTPKLRIGAVSYLNTKPLIHGFQEFLPEAELTLALPSRLADGLASGTLDVALIPSIEAFQDPTYRIVSDACIGCRGPVLSVKLFSRVPVDRIQTLALDEGSRTSAALVQILLQEKYGVRPQLEGLPIGADLDDAAADAVLLIGDRAIHSPRGPFREVWDLGDRWTEWSSLPFVFAMWTARPGFQDETIDQALGMMRDAGLANLTAIAEREAAPLGLTIPQCYDYLKHNLHFFLGEAERQGLELFYRHACRLGMAPAGVDLEFAHLHPAG